ncbi:MAG: class I SAM-dependent methyltransferase, partial [Haemophilus parainfluenzae]|nr:class I SAM-dependent methyltransferase [Haemophilus parainfluenzae]
MSNNVNKDNLTVNFSTDWFTHNIPSLSYIFEQFTPQRILEIGSFEGRSTHFFTEEMLKYHNEIEIHSIDSWEGGLEHQGKWDMSSVEQSFNENIQTLMIYAKRCGKSLNIIKHKGYSHTKMIELLAKGKAGKFDFIYV